MDAPQLVTFMSDSVAARIDSPEFWAGLDRLRTEWGMDMPQLVKFMGNSVAARIRSPELWAGLDRLRTEWGMDILKYRSFADRMGHGYKYSRLDLP